MRELCAEEVRGSEDFRRGINYAVQHRYASVHPTVDVAVVRKDRSILLGRKKHEERWRFPGGFADPQDESFEAAAKRELREECGSLECGELRYVGSFLVNDWRYKSEVDAIITALFLTEYIFGNTEPGDDLNELRWFSLDELNDHSARLIVAEHLELFQAVHTSVNDLF